jgi:hypothetical protein
VRDDGVEDQRGQRADVEALRDRRIMAPGAPELVAYDCEALILTMSGIGRGQAPGAARVTTVGPGISAMGLRHIVFSIDLVRWEPMPSGGGTVPPTVETMNAAAAAFFRDAGLLSQALVAVGVDVARALPRGSLVEAGAVVPVGPEGGLVGLRGTVSVTAGTLV